ncbi:HAMP domain-containing sensor histidine kinase [Deinococcus sp. AJ005]|uniref:sensor histidine kinase n=1 Tax=Deinococcus sp. AJ005 TaxID=2652443 RepID=UPI00125CBD14|nr:HAMP domain-containing sensor histidine kinase [Deinococcus sp. AJ005]QFP76869.1 HAMP domain-containing histidine kinase [Deinococcus sp. AJ005]
MTLRARLTLLTFSILLLSLLASAGVAGTVLWRLELSSITRQIGAQANALLAVARATPGTLPDRAENLLEVDGITAVARVYGGGRLRWAGGAAGPDILDPGWLAGTAGAGISRVGGYLVSSTRANNSAVQVGRNLLPLERSMRLYALVTALTLLLLSALGGALVAREVRRTLRPLEALAARVQTLDAPGPLPALTLGGEVGALARALDASLGALRAERERETLFLASASHELRTPVTALLADLEHTLARPRSPQEMHAVLERTQRTASRLRLLTGNLMTLTRAQRSGTQHLQPARSSWPPVDLLALAGEAVDLLQPLALRQGLDLWLDGQATPLRGDSALLGSVLENLIGNALKFTPRSGEVQVRVVPHNGGAHLTVQDSGPGFPGGALTEAFVRGEAAAGAAVEGFGLGLAVVRQVVEIHGGTLTLDNPPEGGARVQVSFPSG